MTMEKTQVTGTSRTSSNIVSGQMRNGDPLEDPTSTRHEVAPNDSTPNDSSRHDGRTLKGKRGVRRLVNALNYSKDGFRAAWAGEDAFRQEVVIAAVLVPIACLLHVSPVERVLLIGSVVLVLIVELLNTAVEAAIDRQSYEINPLAKQAKDFGSSAVLLSLLLTAGTWASLLLPRALA
jgi:diacylglycerol kinase (ATP)